MYLYSIDQIDYFAAFMPLDLYLERLSEEDEEDDTNVQACRDWVEGCVRALAGLTSYSEADRVAGPFISAIPDGSNSASPIVVVKAGNNGGTYVASPFELPWLSDRLTAEAAWPKRPLWDPTAGW